MTSRSPRVFISYAHDTEEHKTQVLNLANRLRNDAVDCHLDRYYENGPVAWPQWMREQVRHARYVLVVGSPAYLRRFEHTETRGKGRGAKWEGGIITQELYEAEDTNDKFLPVIFSRGDELNIPIMLRGGTQYLVDSEDGYRSLYRRLTGQPEVRMPPLGRRKTLPVSASTREVGAKEKRRASAERMVAPCESKRAKRLVQSVVGPRPNFNAISGKLRLLDAGEIRYVVDALIEEVENPLSLEALADVLAHPPAALNTRVTARRILEEATIGPEIATKVGAMKAIPVALFQRVGEKLREVFFSEIVEIMERDQYVEVNRITPAVTKVHEAIPSSLHKAYMSALFSQAQSRAFEGQPAAEAALKRMPDDLAVAGLEQLDVMDFFGARKELLVTFVKNHRSQWPAEKRSLFSDLLTLDSDEFTKKHILPKWKVIGFNAGNTEEHEV